MARPGPGPTPGRPEPGRPRVGPRQRVDPPVHRLELWSGPLAPPPADEPDLLPALVFRAGLRRGLLRLGKLEEEGPVRVAVHDLHEKPGRHVVTAGTVALAAGKNAHVLRVQAGREAP